MEHVHSFSSSPWVVVSTNSLLFQLMCLYSSVPCVPVSHMSILRDISSSLWRLQFLPFVCVSRLHPKSCFRILPNSYVPPSLFVIFCLLFVFGSLVTQSAWWRTQLDYWEWWRRQMIARSRRQNLHRVCWLGEDTKWKELCRGRLPRKLGVCWMYGSFEVYYCPSVRNEVFYFWYCTTIHTSQTNQIYSMLERQVISSHINSSLEEKKKKRYESCDDKTVYDETQDNDTLDSQSQTAFVYSHEILRDCGRVTIMSEESWVSVLLWTFDVPWYDGWKRPTERDRCPQKFDKTNNQSSSLHEQQCWVTTEWE